MYATTEDLRSEVKRAKKHVRYFAKTLGTDKCLIGLCLAITIAIVVIIYMSFNGYSMLSHDSPPDNNNT